MVSVSAMPTSLVPASQFAERGPWRTDGGAQRCVWPTFERRHENQPGGSTVSCITCDARHRAATHPTNTLVNSWDLRYRRGHGADECKPHGRGLGGSEWLSKKLERPIIRRWRKNMEIGDDPEDQAYVDMLTTLSEGSVRRNFNPYTDIDWDSPEFAVVPDDDPLDPARHRPDRPPPLVHVAAGRAADRDRHVAPGQRRQGRPALRVDPDPRFDELRVLGARTAPRSTATACTNRSKSATTR